MILTSNTSYLLPLSHLIHFTFFSLTSFLHLSHLSHLSHPLSLSCHIRFMDLQCNPMPGATHGICNKNHLSYMNNYRGTMVDTINTYLTNHPESGRCTSLNISNTSLTSEFGISHFTSLTISNTSHFSSSSTSLTPL